MTTDSFTTVEYFFAITESLRDCIRRANYCADALNAAGRPDMAEAMEEASEHMHCAVVRLSDDLTGDVLAIARADAIEPDADAIEPDADAIEPDADAIEPDADAIEPDGHSTC